MSTQETNKMSDTTKENADTPAIVPGFTPKNHVPVGGTIPMDSPIEYNRNRNTIKLTVRNTGDRPIQVGSHFHFFEVNRYLQFDRKKSFGYHLNIPATTAIRFEPGDAKEVELVSFGGKRVVIGFSGIVNGYTGGEDAPSYYPEKINAFEKLSRLGFKDVPEENIGSQFPNK